MTEPVRASNMDIKKLNFISTMRSIFSCDQVSQPELAQKLSLSGPTILQNVKELVSMGLVKEAGAFESTGGRKAKAYAPIRDARVALGLDITQNHIGLVLVDLTGQILKYKRERAVFSLANDYFSQLSACAQNFFLETGYSEEVLLGAGVSLPGIVDEENRGFVSHILNLHHVSLDRFSDALPYPCRFINDANAAGFAEVRETKEQKTIVYLSLSNSVGGAILRYIPGNQIYMGDTLKAGEIGHMTLFPGGAPCYCGKQGCLDAYCSAKVLSSYAGNKLADFFEGLRAGDPVLTEALETYLDNLAIAINNLHMIFDCNIIVGGYVGSYMEEHLKAIRDRLVKRNTFEVDGSYLHICRYRQEAAALGAALLQVEDFITNLK